MDTEKTDKQMRCFWKTNGTTWYLKNNEYKYNKTKKHQQIHNKTNIIQENYDLDIYLGMKGRGDRFLLVISAGWGIDLRWVYL